MEGPQDPPFKFFPRSGSRLGIVLSGMKGFALSAIASILMLVQCVKALFTKSQLALPTLQSRRRLLNRFELVSHEYVWYWHLFICFSFGVDLIKGAFLVVMLPNFILLVLVILYLMFLFSLCCKWSSHLSPFPFKSFILLIIKHSELFQFIAWSIPFHILYYLF